MPIRRNSNIALIKFLLLTRLTSLCFALFSALPASAEESRFAFLLQNDIFTGRDGGGYTNGISLAHIRNAAPAEAFIAPQWLLAPVAQWFSVGPAVMTVSSLNQLMVTPGDITRKEPAPSDAPYMGALWGRAAQVSISGAMADMLAVELGMIGPASGARQSQILIHRITGSDRPEGWDSQVPNRVLLSLERYRGVRFARDLETSEPMGDAVLLGGGKISTLQSSIGGSLLLRYGTNLVRSYPTTMRAVNLAADPVVLGRGWFVYGGVHVDHVVSRLGGFGERHPLQGSTARLRGTQLVGVMGAAYGWDESTLSFSLQNTSSVTTNTNRRKAYGSLTYTRLLH